MMKSLYTIAVMFYMLRNTLHSDNNLSPVFTNEKYSCSISSQRTHYAKFEQYMCRFRLSEENKKDQLVVILDKNNFADNQHCTILCLRNRNINLIKHGALKHLNNIHMLDLSCNKLSVLKAEMFEGLKSLKRLELTSNKLHHIVNDTFKHLSSLEILELTSNDITNIAKGSFNGLSLLTHLNLRYNELRNPFFQTNTCNRKGHFANLKSLVELDVVSNEFTALYACTFTGLKSLKLLNLAFNSIKTIENDTFFNLPYVTKVNLQNNKLTTLQTWLFAGLTSMEHLVLRDNSINRMDKGAFHGLIKLTILDLDKNKIETINQGVFNDLSNLTSLDLGKNELTHLTNDMFKGLFNLKELSLMNNKIKTFEQNVFRPILVAEENVTIDMRGNNLSDISWTLFARSPFNLSFSNSQKHYVTFFINPNHFHCTRSMCWMNHYDWLSIYTYIVYDDNAEEYVFQNELKLICNDILEDICPSEEKWCMNSDEANCKVQCISSKQKGGQLVIDGDVCPFQYFCQCECYSCEEKCALTGQVSINETFHSFDIMSCSICKCECPEKNCWKSCNGHKFFLTNNTFGCPECECLCPEVDCDAKCNGTEGITRKDEWNCTACDGCKDLATHNKAEIHISFKYPSFPEKLSEAITAFVPSSVSFIILCVLAVIIFSLNRRRNKPNLLLTDCGNSVLDILTQKIPTNLAQQVKENWVDSSRMCVEKFIGTGHFGIVWSGTYEKSIGEKLAVAIKVAKAQYQEIWTVEAKWNAKHELRPHFEKRPVQIQLSNQIIEGFLMEAIVMRKFDHPNVLWTFGISAYEEKPCIILPLMINGDLKKYLKANKVILTDQNLTSFSLGVAKGMTHIAERNYVHCDLAARNCMLDSNLVIKISDFGLTRNINDKEYNKSEEITQAIPVRWMSIETIQTKMFTLENDVWSYGVVLWEIYNSGELPYGSMENIDVIKYLSKGLRLNRPKMCPDNIYNLMLSCWNHNPEKRPNFSQLSDMLDRIAEQEADYTEVRDESPVTKKQ